MLLVCCGLFGLVWKARSCRSALITLATLLAAHGMMISRAEGQGSGSSAAASSSSAPAADELAAKRTTLADRISKLKPAAAAPAKDAASTAAEDVQNELDLLESLDLAYIQQQAALDQRSDLADEKKRIVEEAQSLHNLGPAEPKPYAFLLLDDVRDQLGAEEGRTESTSADLTAAQNMLQVARQAFEECERQRRAAREAVDNSKNPAQQPALARELRLAELRSSIAQETVTLRRIEIELATERQAIGKQRRDYLQEKVQLLSQGVQFSQKEFDARLELFNKGRDEARQKLKDAQKSLQRHEADQQKALAELKEAHTAQAVVDAATAAYQLARRVHCEEIALVNQRLAEMEHFRHFFTCRFELANGKAAKEAVAEWRVQVADTIAERKSLEHSRSLRLQELHIDQSTLLRQSHTNTDAAIKPWLEMQVRHLQRLVDLYESNLLQLQSSQRYLQRFLDDLQSGAGGRTAASELAAVRQGVVALWNYELASVDDHPVTIGKIFCGILYLLVGFVLARVASRVVASQVLPRLGLNDGACHAVRAILFYALCVLFSLVSLELVNLPFAAFTFLGGAAAIGIGFGSQNIVNNFISGLILLAEQPLRVGDMVAIEGTTGTVEQIGARSTRVRTMANYELVVPNSKLLDDNVTNLTLTDNLVRTAIGVTLSPSLPVTEVRRRLLQAATKHPKVLNEPPPVVLFLSFSKSDMSFELHFWLKMAGLMESRLVESEVREAINSLLDSTDAATKPVVPASPPQPGGPARAPARPAGPAPVAAKPAVQPLAGKVAPAQQPQQQPLRRAG